MDVMSETNFKAPSDWAGYKEYSHWRRKRKNKTKTN